MPTFPGTQVASGVGTFLLMPDNAQVSFGNILRFDRSVADIIFTLSTGAYTYTAPTELFAQKILAALRLIPSQPASFYVVTQLIPTFAVFSLDTITGAAAGGTVVTATGLGFVDGLVANLGGTVAAATWVSATSFTFVTPPGTVGDVVILTVRNPDGTETVFPNAFTYT